MLPETAILYRPHPDRDDENAHKRLLAVASCCQLKVVEDVFEENGECGINNLVEAVLKHLVSGGISPDNLDHLYDPKSGDIIPICTAVILSSRDPISLAKTAENDGSEVTEKWYQNENRMWFYSGFVIDFAVIRNLAEFIIPDVRTISQVELAKNKYSLGICIRSYTHSLCEHLNNYKEICDNRTVDRLGHNQTALEAIYEHVREATRLSELQTQSIVGAFTNSRGPKYIKRAKYEAERKAMERMLKDLGEFDCFWQFVSRREEELKSG